MLENVRRASIWSERTVINFLENYIVRISKKCEMVPQIGIEGGVGGKR